MNSLERFEVNKCRLCEKAYAEPKRLYRHMFDTHGVSREEIDLIKSRKRNDKVENLSASKDKPIFPCEICRRPYLSKLGLINHKAKLHNEPKKEGNLDQVICPINICAKRVQTYFDLATHCDEEHRDLVLNEELFRIHRCRFPDFDKFQDWKTEQEEQTGTKFYTRSTDTKSTLGRKSWTMKCLHTQKTNKSVDFYHSHCPAFIRVLQRHSGVCEAVACFGHLGHPHFTQNEEVIEYMKRSQSDLDSLPPQAYMEPDGKSYVSEEKGRKRPLSINYPLVEKQLEYSDPPSDGDGFGEDDADFLVEEEEVV